MTRVRKGGKDADRVTGNMAWLVVEHPEARPAKEDGKSRIGTGTCISSCPTPHGTMRKSNGRPSRCRRFSTLRKYFSHAFDPAHVGEAGRARLRNRNQTPAGRQRRHEVSHLGHQGGSRPREGLALGQRPRTAAGTRKSRTRQAEIVAGDQGKPKTRRRAGSACRAVASYKLAATTRAGQAEGHDARLTCASYWDSRLTPEERRRSPPPSTGRGGG